MKYVQMHGYESEKCAMIAYRIFMSGDKNLMKVNPPR